MNGYRKKPILMMAGPEMDTVAALFQLPGENELVKEVGLQHRKVLHTLTTYSSSKSRTITNHFSVFLS